MITKFHILRPTALPTLLLGWALSLNSVGAQQVDPFAEQPAPQLFDIQSQNLDLQGFVTLLADIAPGSPNIVVPTGAENIAIPDLSLKQVQFREVLEVVTLASRSSKIAVLGFQPVSDNIWVVEFQKAKTAERELAIFPADQLLRGRDISDLIALVEKAFDLAEEKDVPKFNLHEETSVLMAMLTQRQRDIVEQVFSVFARPQLDGKAELNKKQAHVDLEFERVKDRFQQQAIQLAEIESVIQRKGEEKPVELLIKHRLIEQEMKVTEMELQRLMEMGHHLRTQVLGLSPLPGKPTSRKVSE